MSTTIILMLLKYKDQATQEVTEVRFSNAPFDVVYQGSTWHAAGSLLSISKHESNYELVTEGLEITLSGLDNSLRSIIDRQGFRYAPVDILLGTLPDGSDEVSAATYYHRGFALTPVTEFDESSGTITVSFETQSAFKDLDKHSTLMTTSLAHHSSLHPNDKFFQYVADTSQGEETWKD